MAIIRRKNLSGETRYQVKVRDVTGRWFATRTFDRKDDAERHERELLQRRDSGHSAPTSELRQMAFRDFWIKWSTECRNRVSDGWRQSQDMVARKYLLPELGHLKLMEIKSADLGVFFARLERKGLSAQSILHVYNIIHKMFGDAVEFFEFIDINPVRKRFRPRVFRIEREFLSPADSWKLLEACRDEPLGIAVWISTLSGLRPGEVQALKWSAVDFERNQILIQGTFNKKLRVMQNRPKQGDWGRAPMPRVLADFLMEKSRGKRPNEFVCPNAMGGMLNYETFSWRTLGEFCKKAGVKRVTPHELRHSCTEIYVQAGASAEDLRRLLNHKSLSATIHYMHRTDERLQGIAAKVEPPKSIQPPAGPVLKLVPRLAGYKG